MSGNKVLAIKDPKPFQELAAVSKEYHDMMTQAEDQFMIMAITANAIAEMRKRLPDPLVQGFKALENSRLGFKTDKNNGGYPVPVVRECLIEAALMGLNVMGNEFNIIAGNVYITKEGFTGKMQRDSRFDNVCIDLSIPEIRQAEKRAIVKFKADWKYGGKGMTMNGEIPVKWDNYSSDDAILGKAERKARARIWTRSTGTALPEGDAESTVPYSESGEAELQAPTMAEGVKLKEAKDVTPDPETPKQEKPKPKPTEEATRDEVPPPSDDDDFKESPQSAFRGKLARFCAGDEEAMLKLLADMTASWNLKKPVTLDDISRFNSEVCEEFIEALK